PRFERLARHLADLQTETAQDSPNAQFHVQQPSEKLLARNQQRSDLLRSNRFGVHLLEPSHPQQPCNPPPILPVPLHCHPPHPPSLPGLRLYLPPGKVPPPQPAPPEKYFKLLLPTPRQAAFVITPPPQAQSDSPERQVPSRNKQELPVRSQPSPPLRSCLAHP